MSPALAPKTPRVLTSARSIASIPARTKTRSRQRSSTSIRMSALIAVPVCPVEAIFENDEVPEKWKNYIEIDAQYYADN